MWTAIVLTCPQKAWCTALELELQKILKFRHISSSAVLVVPDPGSEEEGGGVGSGGATLNALLVVTEHLSARAGHTTLVPDLLLSARILIVHLGPPLLPLPTGLLYVAEDECQGSVVPSTNLERTIQLASSLVRDRHGVLVASADILLAGSLQLEAEAISLTGDIVVPTVRASAEYASQHGVLVQCKDGSVSNILYQPSAEQLQADQVDVISGLVWFQPPVAESLIKLYSLSPIDGCTYMGADSGEAALQMSLYYDILPAACSGVTKQEFELGHCGKTLKRGRSSSGLMTAARREVWAELRRYRIWALSLTGLTHKYLSVWQSFQGSELVEQWRRLPDLSVDKLSVSRRTESRLFIDCSPDDSRANLMINSGVAGGAKTSEPCKFTGEEDIVSVCYPTRDHGLVTVIFSQRDELWKNHKEPGATFLGRPWTETLAKFCLSEEKVWENIPQEKRNFLNAKLFQSMSLKEILSNLDLGASLSWRSTLHEKIFCNLVRRSQECGRYLDIMRLAHIEGWHTNLLNALDSVSLKVASTEAGPLRTSKLASVLAMTADLLGVMADGRGGLRSGPAHNKDFSHSFGLLEKGDVLSGLDELIKARDMWLDRPTRMIRAARHYEGVVQLLVRQTVLSARSQIKVDFGPGQRPPPLGARVVARCPARLDLSGGWTDTPPICYEMGGKVVDLAVTVDGNKPIGCQVTRVGQLVISIKLDNGKEVSISKLEDMMDHCNPTATGALIKCCLLAAKIVDISDPAESLDSQLSARCGGGLEVSLWSDLPQGSGMGTSSILAGAVISACWSCVGLSYTRSDLVHAVLVVEQLLTTGGGWQDQVGGLHPGINLGSSESSHQVKVTTTPARISDKLIQQLNSRLLLLYTGKPRLAKNLLQNVIR